jgi:mannosyltransferase
MSTAVSARSGHHLGQAGRKPRLDWTLLAGPVVTLVVVTWGIGAVPYWGDEVDTVSAVSRSVPQLLGLLGRTDAVHGLYYLLLWPVARLAGTGEFATRFPSALAMAAAALGVGAIARRLVNRRAGLCAGLVFAVLPTVSAQGQDARPYAMSAAAAVLSSYLFVRAAADPRARWFTGYGLSLVLLGYLHMFGLLLVAAHVVTLIAMGWRRRFSAPAAWLTTYAAVAVAMLPLLEIGWDQRSAIAWIHKPDWRNVMGAAKLMAAGTVTSVIVLGVLALLGVIGGTRLASARPLTRTRPPADLGGMLSWLAGPWLVLPPAILLAVSALGKPVYDPRYITFCLPAVALLAGTGLAALRLPLRLVALALVVVLAWPAQLTLRAPGGGGLLTASQWLRAHERPGDALVLPQTVMIPPWSLAYPAGFAPLPDLNLRQTPAECGCLWGTSVPSSVLDHRELGVHRIWVVEAGNVTSPAPHIIPAFHLVHEWTLPDSSVVWLYARGS